MLFRLDISVLFVLFLFNVECNEIKTDVFRIDDNIRVISGSTEIENSKVLSFSKCAALCSRVTSCCTATYNKGTKQCQLYSCCNPTTQTSNGMKSITKSSLSDTLQTTSFLDCDISSACISGIYDIFTINGNGMKVYCDMTGGGKWTVIQRRVDNSVDFNLHWSSYKTGFGNLSGNFWIGNDNLYNILNSRSFTLRFDLEDWNGDVRYAEYSTFRIADESENYRLTIGGYSSASTVSDGTGGDEWGGNINGQEFSTRDRDNDGFNTFYVCSDEHGGGWWYNRCSWANVNAIYYSSPTNGRRTIYWKPWTGRDSLKYVAMKIKVL